MNHAWQKPTLIVLAISVFFLFNGFNHMFLSQARLDLTENQLFTLSDGSRRLVQQMDGPVRLYFFFSE
ncbi:MAG: hypothetical protein ACO20O_11300, partial [Pseudomonadales bacterium]